MFKFFTCLFCFGIPPTLVERDPERCSLDPKSRVSKVFDAAFVVLCSAINCVVNVLRIHDCHFFPPCASWFRCRRRNWISSDPVGMLAGGECICVWTLSQIFPIIKIHGKLEPKTAWRCNGFAPSPMSSGLYAFCDQRKEHGRRTPYLLSITTLNA